VQNEPYIVRMVTPGGGGGECDNCLQCVLIECEFGGATIGGGPDFDADGTVGEFDLYVMMSAMGLEGGKADLNHDGVVDKTDLELFMAKYEGTTAGS